MSTTTDKIKELKAAKAALSEKPKTNGHSYQFPGEDPNEAFYQSDIPAERTPNPYPFVWASQIKKNLTRRDFVEGILQDKSLVVIYGPPGSAKSFLITDIAAHVADGKPWNGRICEQGIVLYICQEGAAGAENRFAAMKEKGVLSETGPIAMMTTSLNLLDPKDVQRLPDTVAAMVKAVPGRVRMIIVDTLSRAMRGDENSTETMAAVVAACDLVKEETGACVVLIHHTGKDTAKGARGNSCLLGALDTEILVTRKDGIGCMTIKKQKDLPDDPLNIPFALEVVVLGKDEREKPVTSCVIKLLDAVETPAVCGESTLECTIARIRDALTINPDGMNAGSLRKLGGRGENIERALLEMQRTGAITKTPGRNNAMIYKLRAGWDPKEKTSEVSEKTSPEK